MLKPARSLTASILEWESLAWELDKEQRVKNASRNSLLAINTRPEH